MSARLRDIPAVPANVPEELARVLRAMREALQRLQGLRGDALDAALTGRSGGALWHRGALDEFAVFDRVLTAAEVDAQFNANCAP